VRSANSAARRLLGLAAGDLVDQSLAALKARPPGEGLDASPLFAHLERDLAARDARPRQIELAHPRGARVFRVASTELGAGRVAVFEDVTELIRSQKLAAWEEMARQVAHEIKNPLTPIKLSAQHMQRAWRDRKPDFDAVFTDAVKTITDQVEILRKIAQEFSLFGRRASLHLEPVDLAGAVREVAAPYAGTLSLRWSGEDRVMVRADGEALRKVLLNLLENAREAMGEGGALEIACAHAGATGEISLRDHGPGIPADVQDRLYEPYFSTKTGGTGLGLAICAQLVEEMGGRLIIENHAEGGAVARLILPAAERHER
jgi:nitrogen fixation/metabolism regulation signal transduction histidine kinase